ncbi:hypothetical protein B0H10DRAFT_2054163, partial [Mycena sp. CBHHK59/15]
MARSNPAVDTSGDVVHVLEWSALEGVLVVFLGFRVSLRRCELLDVIFGWQRHNDDRDWRCEWEDLHLDVHGDWRGKRGGYGHGSKREGRYAGKLWFEGWNRLLLDKTDASTVALPHFITNGDGHVSHADGGFEVLGAPPL